MEMVVEGGEQTSTLVALLGTGGLSAIVAAIVTGLFSRRKLGADAAKIITEAAAGVVKNLENEIKRQQAINDEMVVEHRAYIRTLMLNHAEEIDEWFRVSQLHTSWDYLVRERLATLGIDLPEPPPLTPARRFPKDEIPPAEVH